MDNEIHWLRKQKKITQDKLAEALGVTRQTINAIEQGKYSPSLELAFKLSKFFKKPIEEVFLYTGKE